MTRTFAVRKPHGTVNSFAQQVHYDVRTTLAELLNMQGKRRYNEAACGAVFTAHYVSIGISILLFVLILNQMTI
jgi:hypothetical protein